MNSKLIRSLLGAVGVLLVLIVGALVLKHSPHPPQPFAGSIDAAEQISLQTGAARVNLQKAGTNWRVTSSTETGSFRADPDRVKGLRDGLKDVAVEDVISEHAERAADFEVDATSGVVVTLYGKKSERLADGIFGKQAPDGAHTYFKYRDQTPIYLARGAIHGSLGEPRLNAWRDRALLNIAEDNVLTLAIEAPGVNVALARSTPPPVSARVRASTMTEAGGGASHTWSLNGRAVDPLSVWSTLGVLAHLKAVEFVDLAKRPELAPEKLHYLTVHLQLQDGTTHQLRLGKQDAVSKMYPAAVNAEPGAAWIAEGSVQPLLRKPADYKGK